MKSLLLFLLFGSLHHNTLQGERHPQPIIFGIGHFVDVAHNVQLWQLGSLIRNLLIRDVGCEVQVHYFQFQAELC